MTSPIETNNVVERLQELLVAINEPQPKPLPEDQTSRAAEAMAGREDQRRYGLWRDRINEAQRQLVALVPELLTERQSLSDRIDVLREAVDQYQNAPYRSADWLANEVMTILGVVANDAHPLTQGGKTNG